MKILFLDIDGVVNCSTTKERLNGYIGIEPAKADLIKSIVEKTGIKVVLSSTWRLYPKHSTEVTNKVVSFLDITPSLPNLTRGDEVAEWLSHHPEVTKWAALDDDPDFLEGQKLFQTTWEFGLTPEIAQEVIDWFNN